MTCSESCTSVSYNLDREIEICNLCYSVRQDLYRDPRWWTVFYRLWPFLFLNGEEIDEQLRSRLHPVASQQAAIERQLHDD